MTDRLRVAVLWRGSEADRRAGVTSNERLRPVLEALGGVGLVALPVVHRDEIASTVRDELRSVDGVLVWVDPIGGGEDRRCIDAILREVAAAGVWVSAHPDAVAVMGAKEVLLRTRGLGWGSDVRRWDTLEDLQEGLLMRLADGARVLKPRYGNGGIGVWKVSLAERETEGSPVLVVQGAEIRSTTVEELTLEQLVARCRPAFVDGGFIVDQAFQPRVAEGMIRCYLVADRVVGFARQSADGLLLEPGAASRVMGLPSPKTMFPADDPGLARLRSLVEDEWVPGMQDLLGLSIDDLPVLWDADFILGSPSASGEDSYVLCEINCSCVTPFPPAAPARVAAAVRERLTR